jgi:hypothetical protein
MPPAGLAKSGVADIESIRAPLWRHLERIHGLSVTVLSPRGGVTVTVDHARSALIALAKLATRTGAASLLAAALSLGFASEVVFCEVMPVLPFAIFLPSFRGRAFRSRPSLQLPLSPASLAGFLVARFLAVEIVLFRRQVRRFEYRAPPIVVLAPGHKAHHSTHYAKQKKDPNIGPSS